jgi:hypothetical protein
MPKGHRRFCGELWREYREAVADIDAELATPPETIAKICEEIRAGWSKAEEWNRRVERCGEYVEAVPIRLADG